MKKSIFFLPASIRSHIIPALYVADLLAEDYAIHFAVTNEVLAEIVTRQGYTAVRTGKYRVAVGMENNFVFETKRSRNRWQVLKAVLTHQLYWHRKQELEELIDRIDPVAILIDIFNSTDLLAIYPKYKDRKLIFVNPMLSTYSIPGFPTVAEGAWPTNIVKTEPKSWPRMPWHIRLQYPFNEMMRRAMDFQFKKLMKISQLSESHPIAKDRTSAILFENVPELLLAPLELEFSPDVRKANQYYLGLCTKEDRHDTELDHSFEARFKPILERKRRGDQLIYCSFGTFYEGSDKTLLTFLTTLLDALLAIPAIQVIFSINRLVIETLLHQRILPPNVHLFTRVPQLNILKNSDLYITHGGLSSIKESINYTVPMLVYPLDLKYDQNGNGFKVEYHGLGLRGVFNQERVEDMKTKIVRLLEEKTFKETIARFRESIAEAYRSDQLKSLLNELIPNHAHELQSC